MAKKKEKREVKITSNLSYLLLSTLFLIPFFISYLFTIDYISRANAVSLDEEVAQMQKIISNEDLNNLYNNQDKLKNIKDQKVIILGYHQIREYRDTDGPKTKLFITSPETFDKEMKYLLENDYHIISLQDYIDHINKNLIKSLPERSVVITFDDGYISQYTEAYPILKKYKIQATFFIYTDCVDKYPACMSSDNIRDLYKHNMSIANHTVHHIYLPEYKDDTIKKEILDNEKKLNDILGGKYSLKILAYPFGGNSQKVRDVTKSLGYQAGLNALPISSNTFDKYGIARYLLGNDYLLFKNILKN